MKRQYQPCTPAALYARVSSDRQDVDLSVSAQLRALKDYAKANGYSVAREYVDEAESGRVADRPQFREMIEEGSQPKAPFEVILVWKFSRFTRKREHAVAFKSMLRRKGVRVVSITEHADDSPTGKLMEAIIESVDEFYSENLAQEVVRGMREAASRGFFLGSKAPFGYKRVKISDGAKERPTLKVDPATAPIVKEIFESSLRGNGLKEICKELNDRGITNRGKRWYKGGLHYLLTNEAYTGTAVWGRTAKGEQAPEPVRVAKAWKPLVSRRLFESVQQALHERAPVAQRPARVGSKFLLSGLLRCGVCGRPYIGQGAKSGQYGYYICGTLYREGAGTCEARYLNAPRVEGFIIDKIKERILTDGTITELVTLVAEEIDAMAGEMNGRLKVVWAELADVESRLENLYEALETKQLTMDALSPRILSLRHRQDQLTAAREEAASLLEQRRVDLPGTEEIKGYVADFREFLQEGTFPERKALIRNFVKGIEVTGDEAVLTYTIPMPSDGVTKESASVLDFVQSGPPFCTVDSTEPFRATFSATLPGIKLSSGMAALFPCLPLPDPCYSNCEVADIWCDGARGVDDGCEYPSRSARRPLRQRDRQAEARMRRGDGEDRVLGPRFDRVLLRHGYHRSELKRSVVPPLEPGEQLRLGMAPKQLVVNGDERICSRLRGSVEPIEPRNEIANAGSCARLQGTRRHLEPRQLDDPKAAERVIETLNQRRQHDSWIYGVGASWRR